MFHTHVQVYKLYSELISTTIAEGGPYAARSTYVKYMRSVKKVGRKGFSLNGVLSMKASDLQDSCLQTQGKNRVFYLLPGRGHRISCVFVAMGTTCRDCQ